MNQAIFLLPYRGEKVPVFLNKQSSSFYKNSQGFITPSADKERVDYYYNNWCKKELKPIIQKGIEALRYKRVRAEIKYTKSTGEEFYKKEYWSVDDALEAYSFNSHIFIEIGQSNKEWGINTVKKGKNFFTLFFNINLIKLGDEERIKHVVAHELAHVFVRDHSSRFEQVLYQLDGSAYSNKEFWNGGFQGQKKFSLAFTLLLVIGVAYLLLIYIQPLLEQITPQAPQAF